MKLTVLLLIAVGASAQSLTPANANPNNVQGNGNKFQLSTGTITPGNCAQYDSFGNVTSSATGPCTTIGSFIYHTYTGSTAISFSLYTSVLVTASGSNPTITVATNPAFNLPLEIGFCNDGTARVWTIPTNFQNIVTPLVISQCVYNTAYWDGTNYQGSSSNTAGLLGLANTWTANNTFTGAVVDAHASTKTLPNRSGTGSPNGRDNCATIGETYFQTDATAGINIWACTTIGSPGVWTTESVNNFPSGTQTQYLQIQPNTGNNTTYRWNGLTPVSMPDYNYSAYSCNASLVCVQGGPTGGTISPGATTITTNPCPLGVSGAAVNLPIYISGGSGTAEEPLVTGGTCTSGAATGTIAFTAANSHSGAFTIQSATAGMQEAANVSSSIWVPDGTYQFYAAATFTGDASIYCASNHAVLVGNSATQNMLVSNISSVLQRFIVRNCVIASTPTKTAGDGIQLNGTGGISAKGAFIESVQCQAQWNCIHSVSAGQWSLVGVQSRASANYDVYIQNTNGTDGGDNSIVNCLFDNSNNAIGIGIEWESGGGLYIANTKILNHISGISIRAADGVNTSDFLIISSSIENFSSTGISIARLGTTGLVQTLIIHGMQIASAAGGTIGINVGAGTTNVVISENVIGAATDGITASNTNGFRAVANKISGATNGILLGAGNSGSIESSDNQFNSVTTAYGGTLVIDDNLNGLTYAQITSGGLGPLNGSRIYCSDCNVYCSAGSSTGALCARQNSAWTGTATAIQLVNLISSETGAANAIAGTLAGISLATGLQVTVVLAHTLQAGADTFAYNGGAAVAIKSRRNTANNIATAYAAAATITLLYDGSVWEDTSQ
jgi:hypothetical protein